MVWGMNVGEISDIRKMYGTAPQAAFSLLLEIVEEQGKKIEKLEQKPVQVVRYVDGKSPCS